MSLYNDSGAVFSPCRLYRYKLWRYWDTNKPVTNVIEAGYNFSAVVLKSWGDQDYKPGFHSKSWLTQNYKKII